ncbi:MAG: magnesium and cobalt transport protein CorA [Candidatus Scalindua sp. AMX11]|nr:MAG: magnesium and cobalt transport protein CorA [Candidatus Scalindua sp.]NOG84706.1 magnesium/cobalt transporter CorA [Planctomycetota bacterium]RZV98316.1 MAG: magnesium/cobalt transporter CorA [Candidatus Scalindua sp. SCAELEC01]TDE66627.1 MAG: magnesium and cobalt transport protein CorA [Candidatus Scalindua sp. AMX11]GJQ58965.1 MAG: magnesium and cobalt transport protein CorA [Candidatus Scalindua sp.]
MSKFNHKRTKRTKRTKKIGLPPGTLIHVGEKRVEKARITIIDYDQTHFQEKEVKSVEECFPFKDKPTVTWINIDGIHQIDIIEKIGKHFNLHPLILEDILNTEQRPKLDDFEEYIFLVLKMPFFDEEKNKIKIEQVSLVLGSNVVISFQEVEGDIFNPVRERIKNGRKRIRESGSDYLVYALIDAIVDNYFSILEKIGDRIEKIEVDLVAEPEEETLYDIHDLKREILFFRKAVWPLREVVSSLGRGELTLIKDTTRVFLRDVHDHTIQVIDTMETFRDMLSGMLDLYLSSISNKTNDVMRVLTIIATIFIPLTFIAGLFGMNFEYMPELRWHWSYPIVLVVLAVIGIFMLFYFRRKKWL